jgi:hypothetical protein
MLSKLLNKIKAIRFAKSEKHKVYLEGSMLNAFYKTKSVFIHIPKTAGTSLVKSIYGDVSAEGHRNIEFYKNIFSNDFPHFFKFCFVRNPYDRLHSSYKFLQKGGMNKHDAKAFDIHLKKYADFEDFVLNGLTKELLKEIIHFIPQTHFICNDKGLVLVDFIGKFENLKQDIGKLEKELNLEIILPHLNSNKKEHYLSVYTDEMLEKVKEFYVDDFKILVY